ncbi:putative leader peptide [Frankia sp. Cas8]
MSGHTVLVSRPHVDYVRVASALCLRCRMPTR